MNMVTQSFDTDAQADGRAVNGRRKRQAGLALVALVVAGGAWKLTHPTAPAAAAPPPPVVNVATPLARDVRGWDDYVGRFAPSRTVEIRPRVSGEVVGVHFKDGDIVRAGQLLFTIDPRPFAASLAEARANAASARSTLALATADVGRADRLKGDEAISAGELDSLRARLRAAQAAVGAADARVRQQALLFEFTQVRAPISGRISDRRVDAGNQVTGGEGTSGSILTTINALDPIYFSFDGSEALFLKTQRAHEQGKGASEVEIQLQDESGYRWKGRLDFTDNGLDPRSGTIRGRAVLSNPNYFLTPGMFGNMRLANGGTQRALLVPDEAVQTDQARKTLLVVGKDDKVVAKPVQLGPTIGNLRVIASGIAPTDRVIISGTQMAMPGAAVQAKPGRIATEAVAAAPPPTDQYAAQATFAR
jgi:RND family efflux transporter MFP subunit